jgi:uncharacterized protein (TIGR01244 family)
MFTVLTDRIFVAPQITVADIAAAAAQGVTLIVNNRPDGESADQPDPDSLAVAAQAAGIAYAAIPVTHSGFAPWQLDALDEALGKLEAGGKALCFCRSGTRSTLLWALTRARAGDNGDVLAAQAAAAGYDLSPIREIMATLAPR